MWLIWYKLFVQIRLSENFQSGRHDYSSYICPTQTILFNIKNTENLRKNIYLHKKCNEKVISNIESRWQINQIKVLDCVLTPLPKQIPFEKFNFLTAKQF